MDVQDQTIDELLEAMSVLDPFEGVDTYLEMGGELLNRDLTAEDISTATEILGDVINFWKREIDQGKITPKEPALQTVADLEELSQKFE